MTNARSVARQDRVLRLLAGRGEVAVREIAAALGVSGWTVRRDLADLEERGLVARSYGTAALTATAALGAPASAADTPADLAARRRIGRAAAALLRGGERVAISAGATTTQVARALRGRRGLTVLTNALNIALELADAPDLRVTCTGGEVHGDFSTLTGPVAERAIRAHAFDVAVVGVTGVDARAGLTVASPLNAVTMGLMIEHALQVVVVADRRKLGVAGPVPLAPLGAVDVLVTDAEPPPELRAALAAGGGLVVVAAETG